MIKQNELEVSKNVTGFRSFLSFKYNYVNDSVKSDTFRKYMIDITYIQ